MTQPNRSTDPTRLRRTIALGRALREARLESGMTQRALAKRLRCGRAAVSHRESARDGIGIHALWDTAAALGLAVADIVERAEELYEGRGRLPKGFAR